MQNPLEILKRSENLCLGVEPYSSSEENEENNVNNTHDIINIIKPFRILLDRENIHLGINLSKKSIFEKSNKKNLNCTEKYCPNGEKENKACISK